MPWHTIGNVYIADTSNNRIAEIDTTGKGGVLLSFSSFTLNAPAAVAVDVFGTVYVADTLTNQALMVSPGIDPQIAVPLPMAWGNIYIADEGHNRIVKITTAGVASVLTFKQPAISRNAEHSVWDHGGSIWESVYSGLG